jgi:DNA-binding NarL/FixJ family response regulator
MDKIKVMIFEDNAHLSESITLLLNLSEEFVCVASNKDTKNIIEKIEKHQPQLLLMDIAMPGMNGIETTALVKNKFPEMLVLMLTAFEDDDKIFQAICAGASGYLLKSATSAQKILQGISDVYNGGSVFSPMIAKRVVNFFQQRVTYTFDKDKVSPKEKEVLQHLVNGKNYKMIAAEMNIGHETVKSHIKNIYKKLHVNNSAKAVAIAIRQGIV